jgi:hypothetical protein
MALTTPHVNNELIKFARNLFARGYIRESRFDPYQGSSANSIIRLVKDLASDGKEIRVPLIDALNGVGTSTGTLTGAEEALDNYGFPMWADWLRHAVKWNKLSAKDASISFKTYAAPELNRWYKRRLKEELVDTLLSIPTATVPTNRGVGAGSRINGIKWADASPTQKNNWMDANSDRVIFGSALGNYVAGNFASSAANIDTTADKLSAAVVSLAKRVAMNTTQNKITPYMIESNMQEQYVMFVGSRSMRDLKADTVMASAMREALPRETKDWPDNPLFRAGDIYWDNVIVTEIPEIDERLTLTGIGAGPSNVVPAFLCGTSALALATGQMPRPTTNDITDYEFLTGVGIEGQYGLAKVAKIPAGGTALKDWGCVTLFLSSVADA